MEKKFKGILDIGADVLVILKNYWLSAWPIDTASMDLQQIEVDVPYKSACLVRWVNVEENTGYFTPFILELLSIYKTNTNLSRLLQTFKELFNRKNLLIWSRRWNQGVTLPSWELAWSEEAGETQMYLSTAAENMGCVPWLLAPNDNCTFVLKLMDNRSSPFLSLG